MKEANKGMHLFSGNCLDILCWLEGERTNLICNAKSHRAAAAASLLTVRPQLVWVLCFHSALHRLLIGCCAYLCLNQIQDKLSVYVGELSRWCNTSRLYTILLMVNFLIILLGLCDMTISDGRNKKSIVSYYVLSFISWCRKIHCLRYFFIIWMTAIFTRHHGAWRGDRSRWRTTRTKRGTTSVAWARVFKHCSFKTTDFKLLKRKQQSYVCAVSVSVWEDRVFFLPLYWLWTIT